MDGQCLNPSKRPKIEETVLQILETSDLETATESSIRTAAADRLGLDLSGISERTFVRGVVDSFLLSTAKAILGTKPSHLNKNDDNINQINGVGNEKKRLWEQWGGGGGELNYDGKIICKLADTRMVSIYDHSGRTLVSIRDFSIKDGNMLPKAGVSLTPEQWLTFRKSFPAIQEAIAKLDSHVRLGFFFIAMDYKFYSWELAHFSWICANGKKESEFITLSIYQMKSTKNTMLDTSFTLQNYWVSNSVFIKVMLDRSYTICAPYVQCTGYFYKEISAILAFTSTGCTHIEKIQTEMEISTPVITSNSGKQIVADIKQKEAGISGLGTWEQVSAEIKQTESDVSASEPAFPLKGQFYHTVNSFHSEQLSPIQTIRLDGRNYPSWRLHMQLFLSRSNIAYVLVEPCPSLSLNSEVSFNETVKVKAAIQRWIYDDCICRQNILKSLCDSLFHFYSLKSSSAKELWEGLKSVYDEDFGTKTSQINKYIHFQMVDGVSVLEQVQELHKIANSIMASGSFLDENFHVSVIISKLPPSWKELRTRLLHEEGLALNTLMHLLQVEEDSRNCHKKELIIYKNGHTVESKHGTGIREKKRICFSCGKEGHIAKTCPDRKSETCEKHNEKESVVVSLHKSSYVAEVANDK
ncbi:uncharacterized protein [Primulina eburnea]|uniref:uncharacterized protein n=1 Tax=Primulina eburnea TaxID=1245227 RepID=UPI003C6C0F7D